MKQNLVAEILELPLNERVKLIEAIWDSISAVPETLAADPVATGRTGPEARGV